jgi:hypothetical protein
MPVGIRIGDNRLKNLILYIPQTQKILLFDYWSAKGAGVVEEQAYRNSTCFESQAEVLNCRAVLKDFTY